MRALSDGPGTPDEIYGVYRNIAFDRSEKASDRISAADRLARASRLEIDGANGRQGASVAFQTLVIGSAEAREMLQAVKTMAQGALRSSGAPRENPPPKDGPDGPPAHEDPPLRASSPASAPGDVSQLSSLADEPTPAPISPSPRVSAPAPSSAVEALQDEPEEELPREPPHGAPYVRRGRGRPSKPVDPDAPRGGIFRLRDDDDEGSEQSSATQPSAEQPSADEPSSSDAAVPAAAFALVLPAGAFASDAPRGPVHGTRLEDDHDSDGGDPR